MTALSEYQRLEATGLWSASPDAQRREVVVSLGDASLTMSDMQSRALAHWSLAAVQRMNPGELPAIYTPDGMMDEVLELDASEAEMIAAIERIRGAVERQRPRRGRLRWTLLLASALGVAALGFFWLPGALQRQALAVVPDVQRVTIGEALLNEIERVTGPPCGDPQGLAALDRLAQRLPGVDGPPRLHVMREGVRGAVHLPGGIILLSRTVVEDVEEPDVVAGYVISEQLRARAQDPLALLLRAAGPAATFRLLTTGSLPDGALDDYAETLLTRPRGRLDDATLLPGFRASGVRSTPYAYALDVTGESVLGLIEADPFRTDAPSPVLRDADWLRLQAICGG
ncbi:hypothetical protein GLS40_06435 [Pseudooceanicola sp. 216_PA32_1]|uniref:Uncharacterized protein n=1 Tax=Pseudooceanicola pacificus TaxID=2676438 RepID=A0A844W3L7_9RHOB|nr:hypothetical protein [Pseudooceanicola pacificus]MWB77655.1 hypothetical protein [Pseudooceanicola pacificus]